MDNTIFKRTEQLDLFGNTERDNIELSLKDKFIIPPFTIFDCRQGYWLNRKRVWLSLGIKSEIGREDTKTIMQSLKKWTDNKRESGDLQGNKLPSGVSIFDPVLCEICYKWFNLTGGAILDPFAGGSVRGIVACKLGYQYTGFDLRQEQIQANQDNAKEIGVSPKWICDDSTNLDKYIADDTADMVFTCPPYFDLEVYSDNPNDLSTMSYDEFEISYQTIIKKSVKALKNNRFAVFVVGDIRDKDGFMVSLRDLTIKCFAQCGVKLYNEIILATSLAGASIRAERPFATNRKLTRTHQNVLVFYKGDPKKIKELYTEIDLNY